MSKKYSDIKVKLKMEVTKTDDNALAHLTHYFQNHKNGVSQYFEPIAASHKKGAEVLILQPQCIYHQENV